MLLDRSHILINDKIFLLLGVTIASFVVLLNEVVGYSLYSLLILILTIIYLHKTTNFLSYFSIVNVFVIFYLIFIYLGSIIVYSEHQTAIGRKYLLGVHLSLLLIVFTVWVVNKVLDYSPEELENFMKRSFEGDKPEIVEIIPFLLFTAIAIIIFINYLSELNKIPLLYLFSANNLDDLRFLATHGYKGNLFLANLSYNILLPFLSIIAFLKYLYFKNYKNYLKIFWAVSFWSLFFLTSFACLVTLQKAPLLIYFITLFIAYLVYKGKKINIKRILIITVISLIILIMLIYFVVVNFRFTELTGQGEKFEKSFQFLLFRLMFAQTWGLYSYFEVFPSIHPFLHGRSIGDIAWFFDENFIPAPFIVGKIVIPWAKVHVNTAYLGNAYADFGFWGVIFLSIILGTTLQSINIIFQRKRKTILRLAVYIFLIQAFARAALVSFFTTISTFGVIFVIIIWAIYEGTSHVLEKSVVK